MYKANKLSIRYKDKVITYPDFEIGYGDFVLIRGGSGTGKSSLLNILGLMKKDYEVSIKFCNREIKDLSDKEISEYLSKNICYILQEDDLIEELSVEENIELGSLVNISKDDLEKELDDFGLKGYEDRKVYELSGGEKRRVSLVKAILSGKDILILDEPFYSIDKFYSDKLIKKLCKIQNEKLIVISGNNNFNNTILIDLNDKKVIYKCFKEKNTYETNYSKNKILYRKIIPNIKINFLIQSLIYLFLFFSIFWLKSFENKTEKYFKEDKFFYLYSRDHFLDKSYFTSLANKEILLLSKREEKVNDILIT